MPIAIATGVARALRIHVGDETALLAGRTGAMTIFNVFDAVVTLAGAALGEHLGGVVGAALGCLVGTSLGTVVATTRVRERTDLAALLDLAVALPSDKLR